jgi:hypothetical protein
VVPIARDLDAILSPAREYRCFAFEDDHQHLGTIRRGGAVVAREVRGHVHARGDLVETELVALDVLHHQTRLLVTIGRQ